MITLRIIDKHKNVEKGVMEFLDQFKRYYQEFDQRSVDELDHLYTEQVYFSDPIHTLNGLAAIKAYFSRFSASINHCRFEFVDECVGDDQVWYRWLMHYQHPKLAGGKKLVVSGVSLLKLSRIGDEIRVCSHEDYYDVGAMLYQHIPLLGGIILWIKNKISQGH